jgi:hypothetical protein
VKKIRRNPHSAEGITHGVKERGRRGEDVAGDWESWRREPVKLRSDAKNHLKLVKLKHIMYDCFKSDNL